MNLIYKLKRIPRAIVKFHITRMRKKDMFIKLIYDCMEKIEIYYILIKYKMQVI